MDASENTPPAQFLRRDFLVGSAAGFAVTRGATLAGTRRTKYQETPNPSYAQAGEDVIVSEIFEELKIKKPTYLDVGAFLPVFGSNTYLFYTRGARGALVEPNVDLVPELRARRPQDTVLNVGVGLNEQDAADFYCLSLWQWNTFSKEEAEQRVAKSNGAVKIEKVVKVPLVPINQVLEKHFPKGGPDFLSIDIESLDLAVLKTLDFQRFRPRLICTETLIPSTLRMAPETTAFLADQGYVVRGMTWANTIYIDQTLLG